MPWLELVFWGCLLLIAYSYVLYPLLMRALASFSREHSNLYSRDEELPQVVVLMSAFNEQRVIREKLGSIFNTDYPLNKLQVYIGSDNSTDETNAIIDEFAAKFPQLHFYPFKDRNGKSGVLNKLLKDIRERHTDAHHTVMVMTDANVMFTPTMFFELVRSFKEKTIGQAGANVLNRGMDSQGISGQEAFYIQSENTLKYHEGKVFGAMMGAFGACYAIRLSCIPSIPANFLMEDFYISMHLLRSGMKSIAVPAAICYEDLPQEVSEEFKRKTRISAGNWQNLSVFWPLLFRFDGVALCFFSHKFLRWMTPFLILISYTAAICLASRASVLYQWLLVLYTLFLLTPLFDNWLRKGQLHFRLLRFASYFVMMNLALLNGLKMFLSGVKTGAWSPTKRSV